GKILFQSIFQVIPAERASLMVSGNMPGEFTCLYAALRSSGRVDPFPVSHTVLDAVARENIAILSNDVLQSEPLKTAESLKTSQIASLIAVPLLLVNKTLGVLYLDTTETGLHFDREHLQLITAIAGIAAVTLENVRHLESLEGENRRLLNQINVAANMIGES